MVRIELLIVLSIIYEAVNKGTAGNVNCVCKKGG